MKIMMMIKIHLGSWNEAPVKSHKETSLADAVNDHCVVHLNLYLSSHNVKKSDPIDDEDDVNDHCVVHLDLDLGSHDVKKNDANDYEDVVNDHCVCGSPGFNFCITRFER